MTFNIEYGGEEVDFDSVIDTIQKSRADVVGIEEAWGNIPRIARRLKWKYYDPSTHIISRFPLLAPPESDGLYTYVEVKPGRVMAIGNVHLPSGPYGPFQIRDGAKPKEVRALERRVRLPAVAPFLEALSGLAENGVPSFLVGDFNSPSSLDWTRKAVGVRKHVKFPFRWPVSEALHKAGFTDSYRDVHPNPVKDPGITWPAARPFVPGYNPARNKAPADRIDFVYAAGPATTLESSLVGERGADGVDISVAPWPTDHRGVVSTFKIEPAAAPTLAAVAKRVARVGQKVTVRYHAPDQDDTEVVVVPGKGPLDGKPVAQRSDGEKESGAVSFRTRAWKPGAYDAVLTGEGDVLSRARFWLLREGAKPKIKTTRDVYRVRQPITVEWKRAPGNRWDWVGVYRRDADPNVASYLLWLYTDASVRGSAVLDKKANGSWPLKAGRYTVYLLEDDGYTALDGGDFRVKRSKRSRSRKER